MNKFSVESAKFVSIVLGICFIFLIVVWQAFDYLQPSKGNDGTVNINDEVVNASQVAELPLSNEQNDDMAEEGYSSEEENSSDMMDSSTNELSEFVSYEDCLLKAEEYKKQAKFAQAIVLYKKAEMLADNNEAKAVCMEEIALVYAHAKRYDSALIAAKRAFNLSSSVERELLLARLYYKSGDDDRAVSCINKILERDF